MISVIMPVNLSPYKHGNIKCASDPEYKFKRAVQSYLDQTFKDSELIIISDGCSKAEDIYLKYYSNNKSIIFKIIEKQIDFSGNIRQSGIELAKGEIICYLDHDDFFGRDHLKYINESFKNDWVYYDDFIITGKNDHGFNATKRDVVPQFCSIGTSSIAHKRSLNVVWGDGYGHDWRMIEKYLLRFPHSKIPKAEYYVCHTPNYDF
jgi:glycosyltransferase involved in cell wall biosynthesis